MAALGRRGRVAVSARDRGLETLAGRQAAHDDIDQHLETWTRTLPPGEVETLLRAAGIPAQRMLRIQDMIDHPQGESAFRMMPEPRIGEMMTSVLPFSMSVGRQAPPRPAPNSASIRTKFCANGSDKQMRALRRFARLGVIVSGAEIPAIEPQLKAWIGRTSRRPLEPTTASCIRRYVEATGDDNPLWLDDEFAAEQGFPGRLIPPLLVGWEAYSIREQHPDLSFYTERMRQQLPFPANFTNVRFGETMIEWSRPVALGEALDIVFRIDDIQYHAGRSGLSLHATSSKWIMDGAGAMVSSRRQTLVLQTPSAAGQLPQSGER